MTMEAAVRTVLSPLVDDRVFPDFAPEGTARPYATYQAVGGRPVNFADGTIPDRTNARVQVNVWADTRLVAAELGAAVELAMRQAAALQTQVVTGRVALSDPEAGLKGTMQDFSVWT